MAPTNLSYVLVATILVNAIVRSSCLVRLASWNLLAPDYAKPKKYSWCDPEHLDWEHRASLIVPRINDMDADLICLQEVQVDLWPDFMERLQPLYDGILQNVTRGHNVASALLIRKTCPLQVERFESRSRVLLAVLKDPRKQEKDSKLYLCSVHLEAGEGLDADEIRFYQVQSLFRRLRYHCQLDGTKLEDAPIVLAGDFNMLRTNLMHCDLSRGKLHNPGQMRNKPPISTIPLYDAYLEDSTASSTMPSSPSSNYSRRVSKVQYLTEDRTPKELVKTYARGYVLDYVFTSGRVDVQETLLLHPGASRKEAQKWPSREYPSDHLPIGIDLEWV